MSDTVAAMLRENLSYLVDEYGVRQVLLALSRLAYDRAEEVRPFGLTTYEHWLALAERVSEAASSW